jgi:hypothetical protein
MCGVPTRHTVTNDIHGRTRQPLVNIADRLARRIHGYHLILPLLRQLRNPISMDGSTGKKVYTQLVPRDVGTETKTSSAEAPKRPGS